MKKEPVKKPDNGQRETYDVTRLKGGVRGKYYRQASSGANIVLIEPDLSTVFPDSESVNRAFRLLADTARAVSGSKRRTRR